jgi:hypothetical protein
LHNSIQKVQKVVIVEERSGRNGWVGMVEEERLGGMVGEEWLLGNGRVGIIRKKWLGRNGCEGFVGVENGGKNGLGGLVQEMVGEEWLWRNGWRGMVGEE